MVIPPVTFAPSIAELPFDISNPARLRNTSNASALSSASGSAIRGSSVKLGSQGSQVFAFRLSFPTGLE